MAIANAHMRDTTHPKQQLPITSPKPSRQLALGKLVKKKDNAALCSRAT